MTGTRQSSRSFRARMAAWLCCSVVMVAMASCSTTGTNSPSAPPTPNDQPLVPFDNVPVNVFVAEDRQLEPGQSTNLIIVLDRPVRDQPGEVANVELELSFSGRTALGPSAVLVTIPTSTDLEFGRTEFKKRVPIEIRNDIGVDYHGVLTVSVWGVDNSGNEVGERFFTSIAIDPTPSP